MMEMTYQLARKAVFSIASSRADPSIGLLEMLQAAIYDYVRREFGFEPDWIRFSGYGLTEAEDQSVKVQTAISKDEESRAPLAWALRLKARDRATRRRNWQIQIGIQMHSENHATLYFAQFYYDHLAGSLSAMKPPVLPPTLLFFSLLQNPRLICTCGSFPLPPGAVALDDSLIGNFLDCVYDSNRQIPIVLITCPDLVGPSEAAKILAGNVLVCYLDDEILLETINQALAPQIYIKWDSIQVFMPFADDTKFHPSFPISDISRMGEEQILSMLHQAYCAGLRAEDRRAFVTVDSILFQHDRKIMAGLQERLKKITAEAAALRESNARLSAKCDELQTKYDTMLRTDQQEEIATYETMLSESMARLDRLKDEITSLTQKLYECMGKDFVPEACGEACLSELQHSIFICLARARGRK